MSRFFFERLFRLTSSKKSEIVQFLYSDS